MFDKILEIVAPHICCGCEKVGTLLCEHCMNDIIATSFTDCVVCLRPVFVSLLCADCKVTVPYTDIWCVGYRRDALLRLINNYKFERTMAADDIFARLLDGVLPRLPPETVVAYVPTVATHIRQRGYDHAQKIAQRFGRIRSLRVLPLLERSVETSQRGSRREKRLTQQQNVFVTKVTIDFPVLIIDDIYTTGATIAASTRAIKERSVFPVYAAVVARQPLEQSTDL